MASELPWRRVISCWIILVIKRTRLCTLWCRCAHKTRQIFSSARTQVKQRLQWHLIQWNKGVERNWKRHLCMIQGYFRVKWILVIRKFPHRFRNLNLQHAMRRPPSLARLLIYFIVTKHVQSVCQHRRLAWTSSQKKMAFSRGLGEFLQAHICHKWQCITCKRHKSRRQWQAFETCVCHASVLKRGAQRALMYCLSRGFKELISFRHMSPSHLLHAMHNTPKNVIYHPFQDVRNLSFRKTFVERSFSNETWLTRIWYTTRWFCSLFWRPSVAQVALLGWQQVHSCKTLGWGWGDHKWELLTHPW